MNPHPPSNQTSVPSNGNTESSPSNSNGQITDNTSTNNGNQQSSVPAPTTTASTVSNTSPISPPTLPLMPPPLNFSVSVAPLISPALPGNHQYQIDPNNNHDPPPTNTQLPPPPGNTVTTAPNTKASLNSPPQPPPIDMKPLPTLGCSQTTTKGNSPQDTSDSNTTKSQTVWCLCCVSVIPSLS